MGYESIIVSFLGLLSAIVVWFQLRTKLETKKLENAKDLENLKTKNQDLYLKKLETQIELLYEVITKHKSEFETVKTTITSAVESIEGAKTKYVETQEKADRVLAALKDFIETTDKKFKWVEAKFRDVDAIHMKHGAEIERFGKVILVDKSKGGK